MACLARSIQRNIMLPGGKLQKKTIEVARYILEIYLQVHTFFLHFLYEKQDRDYLCEWKRVSIPFYIFFPCTTA